MNSGFLQWAWEQTRLQRFNQYQTLSGMGTAISWTECSQVAGLIQKAGRSSLEASSKFPYMHICTSPQLRTVLENKGSYRIDQMQYVLWIGSENTEHDASESMEER